MMPTQRARCEALTCLRKDQKGSSRNGTPEMVDSLNRRPSSYHRAIVYRTGYFSDREDYGRGAMLVQWASCSVGKDSVNPPPVAATSVARSLLGRCRKSLPMNTKAETASSLLIRDLISSNDDRDRGAFRSALSKMGQKAFLALTTSRSSSSLRPDYALGR